MTKVLALDISKNSTGWAADLTDGRPCTGTFTGASGLVPGDAGVAFSRWLSRHIKDHQPGLLVYEAPLLGGHGVVINAETSFTLTGLAFLAATIGRSYKLYVRDAHVQKVRKHFIGHGRPKDPKRAVIERCRLLGWNPKNDNEADAAAVWAWAKATYVKGFQYEATTPLFGRKGAA